MPDAFFVSKQRKRKRSSKAAPESSSSSKKSTKSRQANGQVNGKAASGRTGAASKQRQRDEELDSNATSEEDGIGGIDDLDLRPSDEDPGESDKEEDENETPAAKRLRLAQLYLDNVRNDLAEGEFDAAEIDREIISARLQEEVLEHSGKIHKFIAEQIDLSSEVPLIRLKGHRLPVTAAVTSSDGKHAFSSSKDGTIIMWDITQKKQISVFRKHRTQTEPSRKAKGKQKASAADIEGHTDEVLALAISDDGQYLASGGKDRRIVIWNAAKGVFTKVFFGHKDSISALTFRANKSNLYSGSLDRTIKLFDVSALAYVETLFGHQDHVVGLSSLTQETAVSVGSRDRTARFWKVAEESQLVFRGGVRSKIRDVLEGGLEGLEEDGEGSKENASEKRFIEGSLECVAMVDESTFITGGDSGSICVWLIHKKKPQFTLPAAHGLHEVQSSTEGTVSTPRWITSVACLRYSDLIASGSWDGCIRLWKLNVPSRGARDEPDAKRNNYSLTPIGELQAPGIVNSLQFMNLSRSTDVPEWTKRQTGTGDEDDRPPADPARARSGANRGSLLLTAALGQEPRLGRWMRLSGESGAQNACRIYALS